MLDDERRITKSGSCQLRPLKPGESRSIGHSRRGEHQEDQLAHHLEYKYACPDGPVLQLDHPNHQWGSQSPGHGPLRAVQTTEKGLDPVGTLESCPLAIFQRWNDLAPTRSKHQQPAYTTPQGVSLLTRTDLYWWLQVIHCQGVLRNSSKACRSGEPLLLGRRKVPEPVGTTTTPTSLYPDRPLRTHRWPVCAWDVFLD